MATLQTRRPEGRMRGGEPSTLGSLGWSGVVGGCGGSRVGGGPRGWFRESRVRPPPVCGAPGCGWALLRLAPPPPVVPGRPEARRGESGGCKRVRVRVGPSLHRAAHSQLLSAQPCCVLCFDRWQRVKVSEPSHQERSGGAILPNVCLLRSVRPQLARLQF